MPVVKMVHAVDPRKAALDKIGDAPEVEVFGNQVLVATYEPDANAKTVGGIILPDKSRDEFKFQGKVGIVIKKGPIAFVDDESHQFKGCDVEHGDLIFYRMSDGWQLQINGVHCRMLEDVHVKGRVSDVDVVY